MNIDTGAKIHSFQWKIIPISDELVAAVNKIGEDQGQPTFADRILCFEWRPNIPILDVDENSDDEQFLVEEVDQNNADFEEEPLPFDAEYDINVNYPEREMYELPIENNDEVVPVENDEEDNDDNDKEDDEEDDDDTTDSNNDDDETTDSNDDDSTPDDSDTNHNSDSESNNDSDYDPDDDSHKASKQDVSVDSNSTSSEARSVENLNVLTDSSVFVPRRTSRADVGSGVERLIPLKKGKVPCKWKNYTTCSD